MIVKVASGEEVWEIISRSRKLEGQLLERMTVTNFWIDFYPTRILNVESEAGGLDEVHCNELVSWMIGVLLNW